ncbi:MAG: hypothetical protein NTX36_15185 [Proteobacteria bacterium]|nr:hypothetical protein [Pseudomonadota bacterium]
MTEKLLIFVSSVQNEFALTDGFVVTIRRKPDLAFKAVGGITGEVTGEITGEVTAQVAAQVALFCREPQSAREIMEHLQLKHWKTFQENYLKPLIQVELLERTIPDKPTSRLQKYRLTDKGRAWLADAKR